MHNLTQNLQISALGFALGHLGGGLHFTHTDMQRAAYSPTFAAKVQSGLPRVSGFVPMPTSQGLADESKWLNASTVPFC